MVNCNLSSQDVQKFIYENPSATSPYILDAWTKINFELVLESKEEILDSIIWGNSLIRCENKPFFKKELVNSNVDKIINILDVETLRFLSYDEIVREFGHVFDQLMYFSILAAIPRHWKTSIKAEKIVAEIDLVPLLDKYSAISSPSKQIYWDFIDNYHVSTEALKFIWERELSSKIEEGVWSTIFSHFRKKVKPVHLQYMQYKVLAHSLVTNLKRHQWNPQNCKLCVFCKNSPETMDHLLWSCPEVEKFRTQTIKTINYLMNENVEIMKYDFFLNCRKGRKSEFLNLLFIAMKQYIYATKCKNETLNVKQFFFKLSDWFQVDKQYVYENYSARNYKPLINKWNGIFTL